MITLCIEDYCQNCPMFEAEAFKDSYEDGMGLDCYDTNICCKYDERCEEQLKYLKKMIRNK